MGLLEACGNRREVETAYRQRLCSSGGMHQSTFQNGRGQMATTVYETEGGQRHRLAINFFAAVLFFLTQ